MIKREREKEKYIKRKSLKKKKKISISINNLSITEKRNIEREKRILSNREIIILFLFSFSLVQKRNQIKQINHNLIFYEKNKIKRKRYIFYHHIILKKILREKERDFFIE